MRASIKRRKRIDVRTGKTYKEKAFTVFYRAKVGGALKSMKKGGFDTFDAAAAWFEREKTRLKKGVNVRGSRATVTEYLREWVERVDVAASTRRSYRHHVEDYHIPALDGCKLCDLTPEHIEAAKNRWLTQPGKSGRSISRRFAFSIFASLRKALNDAKLGANPCDGVKAPAFEAREIEPMEPEVAQRVVVAFADSVIGAPVVTILGSGLRRGEALGLRWRDVNLHAGTLTVQRSLDRVDGKTDFKPPKTKRSRRTVQLPSFVVERLARYEREQAERFAALGLPARTGDTIVFDSGEGEPWVPNTFGLRFARTAKRHGLALRLHDLRHGYATLALQANINLKVVSDSLGHSVIATTANLYQHVTPALLREQADRIDAIVTGAKRRLRAVPNRRAS